MSLKQKLREQGFESRRVEYADRTEHVVDFGPSATVSLDVVGDTAIVVADGDAHDVDIPADAQVFLNNDVLTIEVEE